MSRPTCLLLAALIALAGACSDDSTPPADAARETRGDASLTCRPADCSPTRPPVSCPAGTVAEFTCARDFDQRCRWLQPRCAPGNDAGSPADGSPFDAPDGAADGGDAPAGADAPLEAL